jgi:hypothetical protein
MTLKRLAIGSLVLLGSAAAGPVQGADNLVFNSVTPCRLIDTRLSAAGPLAAAETRTFHVVGSASDFVAQGGKAGGCGLPGFAGPGQPQVQAAFINIVAVSPAGAGNLRGWASDGPAPLASILNYAKVSDETLVGMHQNIANGIGLPVRQDLEGNDISIKASVSGTHVVADVVGYWRFLTHVDGSLDVNGTATMSGFRLTTGPTAGQVLTSDASGNGTWQAVPAASGDITAVTAGDGLTGGGTTGSVTLGADLAGSGSATTVARSDHDHFFQTWSGSATAIPGFRVVNSGSGGFTDGLWGQSDAPGGGRGVVGYAAAASGANYGVWGQTDSTVGRGVFGLAATALGQNYGVYGQSDSTSGRGVYGVATASGPVSGIEGHANTSSGNAIYAQNDSTTGGYGVAARGFTAVYGEGTSFSGTGVFGYAPQVGGNTVGVRAQTESQTGKGLWAVAANGNGVSYAIYAENPNSTNGYAGYFTGLPGFGRVHITGTLSKGSGSFKIDHPLDPENKYLYHSFVESPDMKNIYDGIVTTDAAAEATVELPAWFEALNRDFRYQLTVIGQFAQAIVAREVKDNRFAIRTSLPNIKVSWQLTGIRKDALAEEHRIPVEEDKPENERGKYLYPLEHGQPVEKGVDWERSVRALEGRQPSH